MRIWYGPVDEKKSTSRKVVRTFPDRSRRVAQTTDHFPSLKPSEQESTTGCRVLRFVKRASFDFSRPFERVSNPLIIMLDNSPPPWYSSLQLGLRAAPAETEAASAV